MDALTAPRAARKTEVTAQTKLRGLGSEDSDTKCMPDSSQSRYHEAAKARGIIQLQWSDYPSKSFQYLTKYFNLTLNLEIDFYIISFFGIRNHGVRSDNRGLLATGEKLPKNGEKAAEGFGLVKKTTSEGEAHGEEATVRCYRKINQRKEVSNYMSILVITKLPVCITHEILKKRKLNHSSDASTTEFVGAATCRCVDRCR